ncbi:MAG: hypothetical protein JOY85_22095 [Acidobacteriaceae bacterium]|nr:hypothetical protein [Acidobacteriaceae bacterium]
MSKRRSGIGPPSWQSKHFVEEPDLGRDVVFGHAPDSALADHVQGLDSLNGAPSGTKRTIAIASLTCRFKVR